MTETEEERKARNEKNHKEYLKNWFDLDYNNSKNDRYGCTCHACQRMIERGYTKKENDWVKRQ